MSVKSRILILSALILGIVILILLPWSTFFPPYEERAKQQWDNICEMIDNGMVVSAIEGSTNQNIDVGGCLSKTDFLVGLEKEVGSPTPYYGHIEIIFSDGTSVTLLNWETETFSVCYKTRYYIIENNELFTRLQALHDR